MADSTTLTWENITTKTNDGHPSLDYRLVFTNTTPDDEDNFRTVYVPCGEWFNGGNVFCAEHLELLRRDYPQGWQSYPGDVCRHGKYTGGVGVDLMCGPCEQGD